VVSIFAITNRSYLDAVARPSQAWIILSIDSYPAVAADMPVGYPAAILGEVVPAHITVAITNSATVAPAFPGRYGTAVPAVIVPGPPAEFRHIVTLRIAMAAANLHDATMPPS
jgi:hypothetical protein